MSGNENTPKHILVVDDEEAVRNVLARTYESEGFRVTGSEDGEDALAKLAADRFDLIVIDVWMPRMTGLEVLAKLKDKPDAPRSIVMTGDNTPATVMAAVREHAFWYLSKPFTADDLLRLTRRVLASVSTAPPIEVLSGTPQWVELLVPCEREAAYRVHDFMLHMESELSEEARDSIGHAFRELLLNAIEWGGELDPSRRVRISCLRAKRILVYRISDPGSGFRIDELPHAAVSNLPDDPTGHVEVREKMGLRPGGLGIMIAQAIVDELIYNEARNEVVFMKYLD